MAVTGLLKKEGISSRLIQTNEGFDLNNIVELRYFMQCIDNEGASSFISNDVWDKARQSLAAAYAESGSLNICLRIIDAFASVNIRKYRSDFTEFLSESRLEDFINAESGVVTVSTMHKAKGREFDHVYMMLDNYDFSSDERLRVAYVGMTRARKTLHIHTDTDYFDRFNLPGISIQIDRNNYGEPEEILLQLTHRDVYLGYFKRLRYMQKKIRGGDTLNVDGYILKTADGNNEIAGMLSKSFQQRLNCFLEKGYVIEKAAVRFVLYWKALEDKEETLIMLPDIYLRK